MPSINFPRVESGMSIEQLADLVARALKEIEWLSNGNIDSHNVRNIAGFNVDRYIFKHESGIVGISGADPTNPNAIRFWAGLADMLNAPFRVTQNGAGFASNFTIEGGVIRTNTTGHARIELSGGSLKGLTSDDLLSGLVFIPTGTDIVDLHIYHRGAQLLEFFDNIDGVSIRPGSSSSYMWLGIAGKSVYCYGDWHFTGSVDLGSATATGKVQYAGFADAAASSSVANSVDWANVTNHPDGTTTPLMNGTGAVGTSTLYSRQDHVHPTDTTRQATITGAATTITSSNLTASRAVVSDSSGKVAVSSTTSTELGYVSGVTSAIQTQLNAKAPTASPTFTGTINQSAATFTQSEVSAYQSSTQSITANTSTKVLFQSETYDTLNEYASSTFTASAAGNYTFASSVELSGIPTGTRILLSIFVNGSEKYRVFDWTFAGNNVNGCATGAGNVKLNQNDTADIRIFTTNALTTTATQVTCYFTIKRQ